MPTIFYVPLLPSGTLEQKKAVPVSLSTNPERSDGTAYLPIFSIAENFPYLLFHSLHIK